MIFRSVAQIGQVTMEEVVALTLRVAGALHGAAMDRPGDQMEIFKTGQEMG